MITKSMIVSIIVLVLFILIQIALIVSVINTSVKVSQMTYLLEEITRLLKEIKRDGSLSIKENTPPVPRYVGSTWRCPECGKENSSSQRVCKDCGYNK